jgi:hypothetical protein
MNTMEQRILDEMVYGRVRSSVNLCQLVILEQELEDTIDRAMSPRNGAAAAGGAVAAGGAAAAGKTPCALAREYVQRAWERLAREWGVLRADLARAECARCATGAECAECAECAEGEDGAGEAGEAP